MTEIAIVGGGAAGMGAAYGLAKAGHSVALFEAAPRLGGHCLGSEVKCADGSTVWVDVGVSDFNRATFTHVGALFDELGLGYHPINQDASFMRPDRSVVWYLAGGQPSFRVVLDDESELLEEMARFRLQCVEVLDDPTYRDWNLGRYLADRSYSEAFRDLYLYPRAQGSFPMPDMHPAEYSVRGLVAFWRMHGIAGPGPADRMVLEGGMHSYGLAFADWLRDRGGEVRTSTQAVGVARRGQGIRLRILDARERPQTLEIEHVVLAVRSNQVLALFEDVTEEEKRAFDGFHWQRASTIVHHDSTLMPDDPGTWGAYNYLIGDDNTPAIRPTITFYPNRLASLGDQVPDTFVTVNPFRAPAAETVVSEHFFLHPAVAASTDMAQARVDQLQGKGNTWYCGSYLTQPWVHEQAYASGLRLAERITKWRAGRSADRRTSVDDFLRQVPLFQGLDTSVLADVQLAADSFSLSAGGFLFRQNDPADGMYLIERGQISISSRTLGDESVELVTAGAGEILGELSLIDGGTRSASARAETPTRGYFISIERFEALKADLQPAAFEVLDRIGTELARYLRRNLADIALEAPDRPFGRLGASTASPAFTERDDWSLAERADAEVESELLGLEVFSPLGAHELHHLLALASGGELARGSVLNIQGDRPEELFFVLRGALRATVSRSDQREQVAVYGPGTSVGGAALLDGGPLAYSLDACEDVELIRLDRLTFETLRKSYSPLAFRLFPQIHRGLAKDLRRLTRHLARLRATRRFNTAEPADPEVPTDV